MMDVTDSDDVMEIDAMSEEPGPSSPRPEVNGALVDDSDSEVEDERFETELLFDQVFANDVIFRVLQKKLEYNDLKKFRLMRRSANNSVLWKSNFADTTRVVISWKTLNDGVLDRWQFPLKNVDLHLFRAAGSPRVSQKATDAIDMFNGRRPISQDQETWPQVWDPDDERFNRLYDLVGSVKDLRIFGVPPVDKDFMDTVSTLQILPSVHKLLARIENLEVLYVKGNLNHWSRTVRSQKPSVSPEDAVASKKALAHVKQFKFVGLEPLLLKLFTGMRELQEITVELRPERSWRVAERMLDRNMYQETMKELVKILAMNDKSLRVLKFDDDSFEQNYVRVMFQGISRKKFSNLHTFCIVIRPLRGLIAVLSQFIGPYLNQLSVLTINCLPAGERGDMIVPPAISFIQEVFFQQMDQDCKLQDLQIATSSEYGFERTYLGFVGSYAGFAALRNCSQLKKLILDFANFAGNMSGIFQYVPPSIRELRLHPFAREDVYPADKLKLVRLERRVAQMRRVSGARH